MDLGFNSLDIIELATNLKKSQVNNQNSLENIKANVRNSSKNYINPLFNKLSTVL